MRSTDWTYTCVDAKKGLTRYIDSRRCRISFSVLYSICILYTQACIPPPQKVHISVRRGSLESADHLDTVFFLSLSPSLSLSFAYNFQMTRSSHLLPLVGRMAVRWRRAAAFEVHLEANYTSHTQGRLLGRARAHRPHPFFCFLFSICLFLAFACVGICLLSALSLMHNFSAHRSYQHGELGTKRSIFITDNALSIQFTPYLICAYFLWICWLSLRKVNFLRDITARTFQS